MRATESILLRAALVTALGVAITSSSWGQQAVTVKQIRDNFVGWRNERVEVTGVVTNYVRDAAATSRFYSLRDEYGQSILVRTGLEVPEVNQKYKVVGTISLRFGDNEIFLHEDQRFSVSGVPGPPATPPPSNQTSTPPPPPPPPPPSFAWDVVLLVVLGVMLLAIVIALAVVLFKPKRPAVPAPVGDFNLSLSGQVPAAASTAQAGGTAQADVPAPQEVIEGRTIKMHAPPPNTIKLLPGWFEVVSGDDVVKQIRFYRLKGDATAETTFGRAAGRPYTHIQLKPMTVSSRQAKVAFEPTGPRLTNFAPADSNPTKVNGRELGSGESVPLSEGDLVEMGEVVFRYQTR